MTGHSRSMQINSSWTSSILGDAYEPCFEHDDTRRPSPRPKRPVLPREHAMLKEKVKRRQATSGQTSIKIVAPPIVPLRRANVTSTSYGQQGVPTSFKSSKGTDLNTQYGIKMLDIIPIGPKKSANQVIFKEKVLLEENEPKNENDNINLEGSNLLAEQSDIHMLCHDEVEKPCVETDNMPTDFSAPCDDILDLPTDLSAPCNDIVDLSTQMSAPCDEITTLPAELDESCCESKTSSHSEFPVAEMPNVKLIKHDDVLAKRSIANSLLYVLFNKHIALSSATGRVAKIPCLKTLDASIDCKYRFNLIGNYGEDENFHVYQICITYDGIVGSKQPLWRNSHHDKILNHVACMDNLMSGAGNIGLQNSNFLKGRESDICKFHINFDMHAYPWTGLTHVYRSHSNLIFTNHAPFFSLSYNSMTINQWQSNKSELCFDFSAVEYVERIVHTEACDAYIYASYTLSRFCVRTNISVNNSNSKKGRTSSFQKDVPEMITQKQEGEDDEDIKGMDTNCFYYIVFILYLNYFQFVGYKKIIHHLPASSATPPGYSGRMNLSRGRLKFKKGRMMRTWHMRIQPQVQLLIRNQNQVVFLQPLFLTKCPLLLTVHIHGTAPFSIVTVSSWCQTHCSSVAL